MIKVSSVLILICLLTTSCGAVGMTVSDVTTFEGFDVLEFDTPKDQDAIFSAVSDIGKPLEYSVSGLDRKKGTIKLAKDAGMFIGVMVGKLEKSIVTFHITNGGKTVEIEILVMGNFGTGGSNVATAVLDQFKSGLQLRL